ncbi:MAG: hypothetical protein OXI15_05130 [Chromatiales bacterium]|nr:hypothetical protein [Chromatiales bacterium]
MNHHTVPRARHEKPRAHSLEGRAAPAGSARERDEHRFTPRTLPSADYLRHAARTSGRSPVSLAMEFLKLLRGPGKLTLPEYVQCGVHDPALTEDGKRRFPSESLHWPITRLAATSPGRRPPRTSGSPRGSSNAPQCPCRPPLP